MTLDSYRDALMRDWSPDNVRGSVAAQEHLISIAKDRDAFIKSLQDVDATGPPITLPDGATIRRLPSITRWIWDGSFAGSIGLRWQKHTSALPPHVLGHIGFSVVPWRRNRGYAKFALAEMLNCARAVGLDRVELTTLPDNLASQKVIIANGGVFLEKFLKDKAYGGGESLRYIITLA